MFGHPVNGIFTEKFYNFDQKSTEKAEKSDFKTKAGKKCEIRDIEELGIFHKCFYDKNRTDVLV